MRADPRRDAGAVVYRGCRERRLYRLRRPANRIADPDLAQSSDKLRLISRGDLLFRELLKRSGG
jgi:hypothetical protein